jgi:phage terminase large subunit-like protein
MGHTVDPQEFLRDYEKSKAGTLTGFNEFKKYRLNIWQKASNPWLKPEDWAKCARDYRKADLLGKRCFAAFDLSLRWDTTAVILVFPWGQDESNQPIFRLWPYFFLPRLSAEKTKHLVPWLDWERSGDIVLTEGNTTNFDLVRRCINEAAREFRIEQIGYDDRFAASLAQDLQDADGLSMVDYNQTPQNFLEPIGMVENLLPAGRLHHPNNRCLNWQAGHVQKSSRGLLEKPPDDTHKKVDGIVAMVMGLGMATTCDSGESVYNTRGLLLL